MIPRSREARAASFKNPLQVPAKFGHQRDGEVPGFLRIPPAEQFSDGFRWR
jgi:hypothetical protein